MQLTYGQPGSWVVAADDELKPEETRNIPFFGFFAGTLISLGIWCAIAWTVWSVVD